MENDFEKALREAPERMKAAAGILNELGKWMNEDTSLADYLLRHEDVLKLLLTDIIHRSNLSLFPFMYDLLINLRSAYALGFKAGRQFPSIPKSIEEAFND